MALTKAEKQARWRERHLNNENGTKLHAQFIFDASNQGVDQADRLSQGLLDDVSHQGVGGERSAPDRPPHQIPVSDRCPPQSFPRGVLHALGQRSCVRRHDRDGEYAKRPRSDASFEQWKHGHLPLTSACRTYRSCSRGAKDGCGFMPSVYK